MAIPDIPSIAEIKSRIVSDIQGKINQTVPGLPLAFVEVLAGAIAGLFFLLYQAILWVYKQIFPESADRVSLVLLGRIIGIDPKAGEFAVLLCTVPGSGAQVDQGTLFIGNNNVTYRVTTATAISLGIAVDVPMEALTSGDIGNLIPGEVLSIVQTDLGLDGTATVTSTQSSGADPETDEEFAARVTIGYRTRKIAGTPGGYVNFGLETPNFIWVGVFADENFPGTVNIYGKVNNQPDGIPTQDQLNELESYTNFDPETGKAYRRPIGDNNTYLPISVREFDLKIFISGSNPQLDSQIESDVKDYADSLEPYQIGISASRKSVLTDGNTTAVANATASTEGAQVLEVTITDVLTGFTETKYELFGGEFVKYRNVTFTAVA